jgi:hypothetical protein
MAVAVIALFSTLGGYLLSQLILYGTNVSSQHLADKLLVVHESLDDAAVKLGIQVQEWKDMLLRTNNAELFSKHQKAFIDSSVGIQSALLQAETTMQSINMDANEIDQLIVDYKALLSNYIHAQTILHPHKIASSEEADRQVIGMDRNLQQHLAKVKANIEFQTRTQLNSALSVLGNRYLLAGFLSMSLWFMALIGFGFAYLFQFHELKNSGLSST